MRTHLFRCSALLASLAHAAWAVTPAPEARHDEQTARLEITLNRVLVPSAELLDWELLIDGTRVSPEVGARAWSGSFVPGPHTIGVRVHYSRDTKTLVDRLVGNRVGFTFVAGGPRWVGQDYPVDARPSSVVRLAATLDESPHTVADRLVVAFEERSLPRTDSGADRWRGEFDLGQLVQERARWVTALVSPQLVQAAGREGQARVRVAVDARGYVREVLLDGSTGSELLDRSVEDVVRLAEPYPVFEGYLPITLPFGATLPFGPELGSLPPSPLTKLPNYRRPD